MRWSKLVRALLGAVMASSLAACSGGRSANTASTAVGSTATSDPATSTGAARQPGPREGTTAPGSPRQREDGAVSATGKPALIVSGPHQQKFSNRPPGEEDWTFLASGHSDPYNWEVWLQPDPFSRGRRCERFKFGRGSRAEAGTGLCGYELPLDFSGPSTGNGDHVSTLVGIVSSTAVRVTAVLSTGEEVDAPQLVKPSDRSDRFYFFFSGLKPGEIVARDNAGRIVGRRAVSPVPDK